MINKMGFESIEEVELLHILYKHGVDIKPPFSEKPLMNEIFKWVEKYYL